MKNYSMFRLFCIALLLCATTIYAREPYAALSNGNTVLTFYYDNQKAARGGLSVGPFDVISYPPNISWYAQNDDIKNIDGDSTNPGYYSYKKGTLSGDVNADGQVGIGDIIAITNFMAGNGSGITLAKGDVNGDGEVGIGDIIAITNIMAGIDITKAYLECPDEHHPHLIDLGLPSGTLWACSNVGADKPDDYGLFFAWGETTGYGSDTSDGHSFDQYNYKWFDQENRKVIKYVTEEVYGDVDNKFLLDLEDDAAYAAWGNEWRTPTLNQLQELRNCTTHEIVIRDGVKGLKLTAANGGTIFIPASGMRLGTDMQMQNSAGYYWSSILSQTPAAHALGISAFDNPEQYGLTENMAIEAPVPAFYGLTVRPVKNDVSVMLADLKLSTIGPLDIIYGNEATIMITSGSGSYKITSSDENIVSAQLTIVSAEITRYDIVVKAHAVGTANITVKDVLTDQTETINVTVKSLCPDENHPHLIDLGLPSGTLWACCNLGSSSPETSGKFYAWGETIGYDKSEGHDFSWENYKWYQNEKYDGNVDNKLLLAPEDDAAYVTWGSEWRMPTYAQVRELFKNTTHSQKDNGMMFTATNGNAIFLPATGIFSGVSYDNSDTGYYWASSLLEKYEASGFYVSREPGLSESLKVYGKNLRPVKHNTSAMLCELKLSNYNPITLAVGEDSIINIILGNGVYTLSSSNENVATVMFTDDEVVIYAHAYGTADITIVDVNTGQSATIRVNVSLADFKLSSLEPMTLLIGDISSSVYIVSGNGDYSVTNSNVGAATATLQYNTIVVEAIGIGSTDITVTDTSLGQSATIHVTVIDICPDNNHPHMIDLGLPSGTKWACCNVGANAPTSYGNYYAWGETNPKSVYNWDTYLYGSSVDNVVNIGSDIAGTSYDAATVHWGASWRMPSQTQIQELLDNCSSTWTSRDGLKGRYFSGSNGGKIFLPAAGFRWDEKSVNIDYNGLYWSSTCGQWFACSLCFDSEGAEWVHGGFGSRETGGTIRPVCQN